jgi:hypothetical protein
MTDAILTAFARASFVAELTRASQLSLSLLQDNALFQLAFLKQQRVNDLRAIFSGRPLHKIWLSDNIRLLENRFSGITLKSLEKGFFSDQDEALIQDKVALLENALVIVNNNDAHHEGNIERLSEFFRRFRRVIFVVWDWDNHHWLSLSYPLAAISDIYCPSHYENLYQLTRFNAATAPVPCGVVQWPASFLEAHAEALLRVERSNQPLGRHILYGGFQYRNQVITTLSQRYPNIGFSTRQFHELTPEQKFEEWIQHKLHLIVPVLNDVPIRLFDAWVTGGIPLVPESLRFSPVFSDVNACDIAFYSAADLIEPADLVERACRLFDEGGAAAILRRHHYGLAHHHGDERIRRMVKAAQQLIGFTLND